MTYEHIILEQADGIATLTLNRPQTLNALSVEMTVELMDAIDLIRDQGEARVLLITGAGRGFSSGADLRDGAIPDSGDRLPDLGRTLEVYLNPLLERLMALPIPVVTAVNGVAAGAGCSYALAGDFVLAARSAYFLQAFVNIGLVPDAGASWLLPRLAGRARAAAMMMLGERISAEQALEWDMIFQVHDDEALMPAARQLAERLAKGPTVAYGLIRQGLRQCLDSSLTEALAIERRHQRIAGVTSDFAEGVAAFREKRPARFAGR